MSYLSDFFVRRSLARDARCAKMVYQQAQSNAESYPHVSFCFFEKPKETKPGDLSENQISQREHYKRQEYAYEKSKIWEERSLIDIANAKTKWQKFWAYRRAPKEIRKKRKK